MSARPQPYETAPPEALEAADLPRGDLLLAYQQRLLSAVAASALVVCEKSRRIGATWALAADAVLRAGASRAAGGSNVMYISYAMDMTREFVDACAMFARVFAQGLSGIDEFLFRDEDGDRSINAFRIDFASGFKIQALSSAPRALRGKQGLIIIDEAAFVDNLGELLKAAMAMTVWGGRVVVISTHNGVDNAFNRLLDDIRSEQQAGLVVRITFEDAVKDGLAERVALMKGEAVNDNTRADFEAEVRAFYGRNAGEELDVIPNSGKGSWLLPADVSRATSDAVGPEAYGGGYCFVGWDVARKTDLSVMYVLEDQNGTLVEIERVELRDTSFRAQHEIFDTLMRKYKVLRAGIDETGMGSPVVEDVQDRHGSTRVVGVGFTSASKLDMATVLRDRFEAGTLAIGDDPLLRTDLLSIKKTGGSGGIPILREDGSSDAHADRFWALALATLVAKTDYQPFAYHSAAPGAGRSRGDDGAGFRRVRTTSGLRARRGAF